MNRVGCSGGWSEKGKKVGTSVLLGTEDLKPLIILDLTFTNMIQMLSGEKYSSVGLF